MTCLIQEVPGLGYYGSSSSSESSYPPASTAAFNSFSHSLSESLGSCVTMRSLSKAVPPPPACLSSDSEVVSLCASCRSQTQGNQFRNATESNQNTQQKVWLSWLRAMEHWNVKRLPETQIYEASGSPECALRLKQEDATMACSLFHAHMQRGEWSRKRGQILVTGNLLILRPRSRPENQLFL